ncbi:TolC family protein [Aquimarina celericrescens]|uniref:TolC family protein n=1 Tax=Aquimarina celericrescens TaxID=1964542 RepID=A0ABW5AUF1_9FLAO|nr:TolC family protein [Aquimarina celericrescens]
MNTLNFNIKIVFVLYSLLFSFIGNAQQLDVFINEALRNSPEIQKFELQYKIASEKVNEVNTLPNTELGIGYFISEPETRTGAQQFKISAKQMIPWFGSITARENYVNALADAKYEDIAIAKRKLAAAVSQSYYDLYALKAKQQVLAKNIALLETYETLALTYVETGKASAVDVLRLQIRQNELEQSRQVLTQFYEAEQTKFNKLLNRNKSTKVIVIDKLIIPAKNSLPNTENLVLHPELIKYDRLFQSVEQSELLNQKDKKPMIGFGLDYIAVNERPDMNFSDNGKDVIMPMVSLSIPIFNKKNKSQTTQNNLRLQEVAYQKQERQNILETALDKANHKRIAARISYNTQAKNLKQAKDAEEILIKSYETGVIDFNDVLDIQELQLKFEINQIESVLSFYTETIIINYLTN